MSMAMVLISSRVVMGLRPGDAEDLCCVEVTGSEGFILTCPSG